MGDFLVQVSTNLANLTKMGSQDIIYYLCH